MRRAGATKNLVRMRLALSIAAVAEGFPDIVWPRKGLPCRTLGGPRQDGHRSFQRRRPRAQPASCSRSQVHNRRYGYILPVVASVSIVATTVSGCGSATRTASATSPACLPATLEHSATLPGTDVEVSPEPESGTANPDTQISFLGTSAASIREVSVVGSKSGSHGGHVAPYSQGDGASFVPDKPFDAGERVAVHAALGARQRRLRLSRRHPLFRRPAPRVRQPASGAGRLPELRHDARRAGPDPERHRARPRPVGRGHPHHQRARSGSVRAADLHAAGTAGLVREAPGGGNGRGSERADLRRPARADVVAGPRARRWASARAKTW